MLRLECCSAKELSSSTQLDVVEKMGDPKGFMKYAREGPKRKPVELRVLDWKEMYEPISEDKLKTPGRALHGLRCAVLPR